MIRKNEIIFFLIKPTIQQLIVEVYWLIHVYKKLSSKITTTKYDSEKWFFFFAD